MKKNSKVILYHTYGLTELYRQVLFSILTLHHHLKGDFSGIKVVVYTDNPGFFEKYAKELPLVIEYLSRESIALYKGRYKFVHRVKICVLQDCFSKYKSDVLYLDSDTYFTTSPAGLLDKISAGTSIMNSNDYDLNAADERFENADWLHIRRAIREKKYSVDGSEIEIPLSTRMWNAGVIGLGIENATLLEEVLNLTDQIYAHRHVFTAEQFAFSYCLQNKTSLISSGEVIFHYWPDFETMYWKRTYNYHIRIFFKRNSQLPVQDQARMAHELTLHHQHLRLPEKNLFQKVLKRIKIVTEAAITGKIKS